MSNFLSKKRVNFPRVILDVLLGSMELAIEMVIKITEDFKILSEVKSLHIARLGYINVSFLAVQNSSIGDLVTHSLTESLTVLLLLRYKERPQRPVTFETFDQSDEET